MPQVPISQGPRGDNTTQPQAMPSEANLLMALATMHKQGRFDQQPDSPNVVQMSERRKPR